MLVIKAYIWPYGDKSKEKHLYTINIGNDGTGTPTRGNYRAALSRKGAKSVWKSCEVKNFPRKKLGVYDLLYRVLKKVVGNRN